MHNVKGKLGKPQSEWICSLSHNTSSDGLGSRNIPDRNWELIEDFVKNILRKWKIEKLLILGEWVVRLEVG